MTIIDDLASGRRGITFRIPGHWEHGDASAGFATLLDRSRAVGWSVGFCDLALSLRPDDAATLATDVERHSRELFERCFHMIPPGELPFASRGPRTADPTWPTVVELETIQIGGATALRVIHRLWYQPGRETVMGHVLVPLRHGLLEFRVTATDHTTGSRESVLLAAAMSKGGGRSPEQVMRDLGPAHYDDPIHDDKFPLHALSRARACVRWLIDEGGVAVRDPAPFPETTRECVVTGRFAFDAPVRHAPIAASREEQGLRCSRVTFAGTDGVETLTVNRMAPIDGTLAEVAKSITSELPDGSRPEVARVDTLPAREGRQHVRAYQRQRPSEAGVRHVALRFFVDPAGWWVIVAIATTTCVPEAELFERAEGVVASYRLLDLSPPPPRPGARPWWRFW